MNIGVFLSTTSEKFEKKKYLESFYEGINMWKKDTCFLTKSKEYVDCDIAIIFGFYGINLGDIHTTRKNIYLEHTVKRNKKCIFIDADLLKHSGKKDQTINTHVRISYDSIFFDKAKHFNANSDNTRWDIIRKQKGIDLLDYRTTGDHILVCLNSNPYFGKGWSAGKLNIYDWAKSTIQEIRQHTDMKIILRFHPNGKSEEQKVIPINDLINIGKNIFFSGGIEMKNRRIISNTSLQQDCQNAWACVVHNTSASVIPILYGVPVFTKNRGCPVYQIANHNLADLSNPKLIDRTQWLNDVAYCLWSYEEIKDGTLWQRWRAHL